MNNFEDNKEDFLKFLMFRESLVKGTANGYFSRLKLFSEWSNGKELTPQLVEDYMFYQRGLNKADGSINGFMWALKKYEKFLNEKYQTKFNVTEKFTALRPYKKQALVLSTEDIERLLFTKIYFKHNTPEWVKTDEILLDFTRALYYLGCRFSELQMLKVSSVDLNNRTLTIEHTKNKDIRVLPLQEELVRILKRRIGYKSSHELVFTNIKGGEIHSPDFIKNIKKRAFQAGIANPNLVHPHTLRHSFATHLATSGVELGELAYILGHRDPSTTYNTYIKWQVDKIRVAMDKLPILKKKISSRELFKNISNSIERMNIDRDRFAISINEKNDAIMVMVKEINPEQVGDGNILKLDEVIE